MSRGRRRNRYRKRQQALIEAVVDDIAAGKYAGSEVVGTKVSSTLQAEIDRVANALGMTRSTTICGLLALGVNTDVCQLIKSPKPNARVWLRDRVDSDESVDGVVRKIKRKAYIGSESASAKVSLELVSLIDDDAFELRMERGTCIRALLALCIYTGYWRWLQPIHAVVNAANQGDGAPIGYDELSALKEELKELKDLLASLKPSEAAGSPDPEIQQPRQAGMATIAQALIDLQGLAAKIETEQRLLRESVNELLASQGLNPVSANHDTLPPLSNYLDKEEYVPRPDLVPKASDCGAERESQAEGAQAELSGTQPTQQLQPQPDPNDIAYSCDFGLPPIGANEDGEYVGPDYYTL